MSGKTYPDEAKFTKLNEEYQKVRQEVDELAEEDAFCRAETVNRYIAGDSKRSLILLDQRADMPVAEQPIEIDAAGATLSLAPSHGMNVGNIERIVVDRRLREISRAWTNTPALHVVTSFEDLSAVVQKDANKQGGDASSNEGI